ncbi:MAG: cation transporter [Deltaproteobacteria bacterium]|nr:cation transporter [Deltaproteobacteria bacterium]
MSSILKKTEGVLDFKMNSTTSTITVTYEDSTIALEEIVEEIRKRKFQINEQTEVQVPEGKPSEEIDSGATPPTPPAG